MTVSSTIGTAGRNYSTLAAWQASLPATLADAYVGECYNDSEFLVSGTAINFSGNTTTSTFTIILTTAPGQSFRDSASVQTNALVYNQANGVGIRNTLRYNTTIIVQDNYVTLSGLQIFSDIDKSVVISSNGATNGVVADCIVCGYGTDYNAALIFWFNGPTTISNCLFHTPSIAATGFFVRAGPNVSFEFCTFCSPSNVNAGYAATYYSPLNFKNCAFFGMQAGGLPTTATYTTCLTDEASPPTGCTTASYSGQFVSTISPLDYRIVSGSSLRGAATADATYPSDIVGTARPQGSSWDVGCWEYKAAAAVAYVKKLFTSSRYRR